MPRNVYLVGSVPLADAGTVFETVSAALGPYLLTLPDGETGERLDWITWLEPVFAANPAFQLGGEIFQLHSGVNGRRRYGLRLGISLEEIHFANWFYADIACRSFATFAALDLVPAHSVLWLFVEENLQRGIDPIYNDAIIREIDKIVETVPHDQLAIQFDIASAVFARFERNQPSPYGVTKEEMQESFSTIVTRLAERVPADVDLLFHFCYGDCYGDAGHRHVVEPTDTGDMVAYANRLAMRLSRPITQIHMPVPRARTDAGYFKPLTELRLDLGTRLCLGLIHHTDGVAGTRRRMAAADRYVRDYAVATECGFGRREPSTIPELLRIHAEIARS